MRKAIRSWESSQSLKGSRRWAISSWATMSASTLGPLAIQFRDHYKDFLRAGAVLFGVSRDNMASHDKFKQALELPFELIADTEEKLCHMFGVVKNKIMYGKKVKGIERSTFLIDASGVLVGEWRGIKVAGHVDEVLKAVKELKKA